MCVSSNPAIHAIPKVPTEWIPSLITLEATGDDSDAPEDLTGSHKQGVEVEADGESVRII